MEQLEIIEVRSAGLTHAAILKDLAGIIETAGSEPGEPNLRIYGHSSVETDVAVHIRHVRTEALDGGSPLGYHLAGHLRRFGLVNHDVWTLGGGTI